MGRCQLARIASITRRSASLLKSRRSEIRPKGTSPLSLPHHGVLILNWEYSAKYIEGLENRLGRMETLLKLSGMLSADDNGRTDLGTLEKRLAERTKSTESSPTHNSHRPDSIDHRSTPDSQQHTPARKESQVSIQSSTASPEPAKEAPEEVEALSDMMCSLVTNNCGETRYIGMQTSLRCRWEPSDSHRIVIGLFDLLPKRHPVGE